MTAAYLRTQTGRLGATVSGPTALSGRPFLLVVLQQHHIKKELVIRKKSIRKRLESNDVIRNSGCKVWPPGKDPFTLRPVIRSLAVSSKSSNLNRWHVGLPLPGFYGEVLCRYHKLGKEKGVDARSILIIKKQLKGQPLSGSQELLKLLVIGEEMKMIG